MNLKQIVAISGKAYSGKSTQADILMLSYRDCGRMSLATLLKMDVWGLFDEPMKEHLPIKQMPTAQYKEILRPVMQEYGMAARALYGENIWVKRLLKSQKYFDGDTFIVDDVRFPNELRYLEMYAWMIGAKFTSIRIHLTSVEEYQKRYFAATGKQLPESLLTHPSETALDGKFDWDFIVNGSFPPPLVAKLIEQHLKSAGFDLWPRESR